MIMDSFSSIIKDFSSETFANSSTEEIALQFAFLIGAAIISWLLSSHWNRLLELRIADPVRSSSESLALRATKRLTFALSFAILILVAHGLFKSFAHPDELFRLVWPFVLVLAAINVLVFLLRVAAGPGAGNHKIEHYVSISLWIVFVLYLLDWLPIAREILDAISLSLGEVRISLLGIIKFLIVSAILILASLAAARFIEGRLSRSKALDSDVLVGIIKVIRYGLVGIAILVALSIAGFNMTTLSVIGGGLGIGIGFGLQKVTGNLISGFLILFDRSIRPGDVISIGESYGRVEKMAARYLVVRDRNGVDSLIPNEEMITTRVINWSYGDRQVRLKLPVQISYSDDPSLAMQLLLDASHSNERIIDDPAPTVNLMSFGEHGINLEMRVWIDDPEHGVNNVRSDIYLAIWNAFKAHGITIPFPQRDIHLKRNEDIN